MKLVSSLVAVWGIVKETIGGGFGNVNASAAAE
jgi:hypothetical protein